MAYQEKIKDLTEKLLELRQKTYVVRVTFYAIERSIPAVVEILEFNLEPAFTKRNKLCAHVLKAIPRFFDHFVIETVH